MMRSFGNRANTVVVDEPFYAYYLDSLPDIDHPGREEVIASGETDPAKVIDSLLAPLPQGIDLYYQKHMCQHMLDAVPLDWLEGLTHVFLIRDPRDVIRSFAKVMPELSLAAIGLPRQVELYERVHRLTGVAPAVIDTDDVLADPETVLGKLCARIGLEFTERMLAWEPGPRPADGVWAKHWYANVNASTGFARRTAKNDPVPEAYDALIAEAQPLYAKMAAQRIR